MRAWILGNTDRKSEEPSDIAKEIRRNLTYDAWNLYGRYDVVVKVPYRTPEGLAKAVTEVRPYLFGRTLTLDAGQNSHDNVNKQPFGFAAVKAPRLALPSLLEYYLESKNVVSADLVTGPYGIWLGVHAERLGQLDDIIERPLKSATEKGVAKVDDLDTETFEIYKIPI